MSTLKKYLFLIFYTKEKPTGGFFFPNLLKVTLITALKRVARIVNLNSQSLDSHWILFFFFSNERNCDKAVLW